MELNFRHATKTDKGDIIVKTDLTDNLGVKKQDFIYKSMDWWYYPTMTLVGETSYGRAMVSELDMIKLKKLDNYEWPKYESPSSGGRSESEPNWTTEVETQELKGKPILLVSCSPDTDKTPFTQSAHFLKLPQTNYNNSIKLASIDCIWNNNIGLSELYNRYITEDYRDHIVAFVHDDVHLDDARVFEKLHEAHERFDVVGLAGGGGDLKFEAPLWHIMTERPAQSGFVSHVFPDGRTNMSVFGDSKKEVTLLDGLFLSVDVTSVLDANVTFDEDFDFHFYDLAFCLRAHRAGLKLGTWPIFVRHEGLGEPDSRWHELRPKFIERYQ